jgi:hypothetical protein
MAAFSEITKAALRPRLMRRAQARRPQLAEVTVRFRGQHAYIGAVLTSEDEPLKLCRLAWQGPPRTGASRSMSTAVTATPTACFPEEA